MQILQPSVEHVYWWTGGAEEEEGVGASVGGGNGVRKIKGKKKRDWRRVQ